MAKPKQETRRMMVSENLRPLKENERLACNKCFKDHGNYCLESLDDIEVPDDFLHNCLTLKSLMQIQSLKKELELSRDRYISTQEQFVAPLEFEIIDLKKELESARKLLISYNELVKKDYKLDKSYSPKTDIDEWLTQNKKQGE